MGLQAIIFDVDGTVAETADLHRSAFNLTFKEFELGWHWDREIFSQLTPVEFTLPKLRLFSLATQRTGQAHIPTHELLAKIAARKVQIFCRLVRDRPVRLRPGVARLMNEARHEGLALTAVSTSSRVETETLISEILGFPALGWFDGIHTSEDAGVPSAVKKLYRKALHDLGISGNRAVAIDDSETGCYAAAENGIKSIATPSLYTSSHLFESAELIVSDLGDPNAPYTKIKGGHLDHSFVSVSTLQKLNSPNSAAA